MLWLGALALIAAGCALLPGDPEPSREGWDSARAYTEALARGETEAMLAVSTGSAHTYARYRLAVRRAAPSAASVLLGGEGTVEVIEGPASAEPSGGRTVPIGGAIEVTYLDGRKLRLTDFVVEHQAGGAWAVRSFELDGHPVAELVVEGGRHAHRHRTSARLLFAFRWPVPDRPSVYNLAVVYRVENRRGTPVRIPGASVTLVGPKEPTHPVATLAGPPTIPAGDQDEYVALFGSVEGIADGVRLAIRAADLETSATWDLDIQVPTFTGSSGR